MEKPPRVYITGTGRSGTTFLMIILTQLELDTGFTKENYKDAISRHCNAGLEVNYILDKKFYISKNPNLMINNMIEKCLERFNIEHIFIPIREYDDCAQSRVNKGKGKDGGLWFAEDKKTQKQFYYKIMAEYLYTMTKYNIPTTFIHFETMVKDPQYLYQKLSPILKDIPFEKFLEAYQIASKHYC